ncbi:hypothetical protein ASJ79_27450, partial [Mycobacterium sp. NAZ190054]
WRNGIGDQAWLEVGDDHWKIYETFARALNSLSPNTVMEWGAGLKCAAANGIALHHHSSVSGPERVALERRYREISGASADHLHAVAAIAGSVGKVVDELGDFLVETGAQRVVVCHDRPADPESLRTFADYVIPQFA